MPEPTGLAAVRALPEDARRVEIISDLHLSPEMPRTLAAFEAWLRHSEADLLLILGDLFEAWPGDDCLSMGFEAQCVARMHEASLRRPLWLMRGNRDFLLGPDFLAASGAQELPDPQPLNGWGHTLLLSHGDALCLDDTEYQRFRAEVRQPAWQAVFLARPLPERLALAAQMRAASRARQLAQQPETYAEPDTALCLQWLADAGAETLLHGHTHRPANHRLGAQASRVVLSDWDLDHGTRAELMVWTADGLQRQPLPAAWLG